DHQKIGVAELVMLIPERRLFPHRGAQVKDRHDRLAGNAERHDHGRMMMAYRDDVAPRLINGAVNDAFGIKQRFGRSHWLGIERRIQKWPGVRATGARASAATNRGRDAWDDAS